MKPNFSLRLRVFNLNCWGIPYLSKHLADRLKRLGDFLNMESFDLALLEEVGLCSTGTEPSLGGWQLGAVRPPVRSPKENPSKHILPPTPTPQQGLAFSGVIGSGLCVFSKHPIQELTQHVYTLNGYPYMIHHGDWFCGKAVGLLVLHLSGLVLNTYVTHVGETNGAWGLGLGAGAGAGSADLRWKDRAPLAVLPGSRIGQDLLHAEYSRQKDIYLAHRVAQAWELAQFIHHTSKKADVILLCGDLNMHPKDLGCRLLKEWTGLRDAFLETQDFEGSEEGYTMVPKNCYVSQQDLGPFPVGIRIDYVLYKAVSGFYISCKTLKTTTGHDPSGGTPLSDHEALMATLYVRHSPPQPNPSLTHGPAERSPLVSVLREAWTELGLGLVQACWWTTFTGYVISLGLLFLLLLCVLAAGEGAKEAAILLWTPSVGLVLVAGAIYLFHLQETKCFNKARAELQHMLRKAREAQNLGPESPPALHLGQQERDRAEEQ
ncbi:Sphingomyelin phosphodiesterase 2 [Tupaia chinensis]|uniref:sphingomyelin phosphodiesterase n=1 Tax=Tupaia chinensis TaxID=246437 RepID=L9JII2_TUPCH|nr:Sphingomyelin phosphodiesterase 2 [Tupaia chinensis]